MRGYNEMHEIGPIFEMRKEEVAMEPARIKEISEKDIPIIGTYCTFTPWGLINAAGGVPVSLCSTSEKPIGAAEKHLLFIKISAIHFNFKN